MNKENLTVLQAEWN